MLQGVHPRVFVSTSVWPRRFEVVIAEAARQGGSRGVVRLVDGRGGWVGVAFAHSQGFTLRATEGPCMLCLAVRPPPPGEVIAVAQDEVFLFSGVHGSFQCSSLDGRRLQRHLLVIGRLVRRLGQIEILPP